MTKLTKEQAAVVGAYTGYLCGQLTDIYIEKIMNRPVFTHEMGQKEVEEQIREKAKTDFLELCAE